MLYFSLVASAVLLLITNLIVWRAKQPVLMVVITSVLFCLVFFGSLGLALPPVLLQAVLLGAIVSVWGWRSWRRSLFLSLSFAVTVLVYGVLGVFAYQQTRQLQQDFAYVSMEDRLPLANHYRSGATLSSDANRQLMSLETLLDNHERGVKEFKASALRDINEEIVQVFMKQPEFGGARMRAFIKFSFLTVGVRHEPPVPQPGSPSPSPWLLDSLHPLPPNSNDADNLLSLHQDGVIDFVNADNFGFMKDRRHVAGFQEHQISTTQKAPERWALQTLDLIGIAMHEEPVVYVSDYLPRMDQLRTAPTRPLDDFEAVGLAELERGEELFVRDRGEERRMVGALRAARQCVACHGCERGDLLGAFSYRLTRDGK